MKNLPNMTIAEIAKEFLERIGLTEEQIKSDGSAGCVDQEIAWTRAKIIIAASKAGWGDSAIGRYLNMGHDSVGRHRKEALAENPSR